jgi:DNA polymerase elongation subunit (family B)
LKKTFIYQKLVVFLHKAEHNMVDEQRIVRFLEGKDPKKYIVNIEVPYGSNKAHLVINNPETGQKYVTPDEFHSFIWFKEEITKKMYKGNRSKITKACEKYKVNITKLKTNYRDTEQVDRMNSGYKYMAKCNGSYTYLLNFFREGGVDVYKEPNRRLFMAFSPVEQYMIGSGRRLFKGMDEYNEVHRLQFDIETTGLYPRGAPLGQGEMDEIKAKMADPGNVEDLTSMYEFDSIGYPLRHKDSEIFQIGVKDNRGFEEIIEVKGDTTYERKKSEGRAIIKFFDIIAEKEPAIIAGYNSEFFDWTFIETRCQIIGLNIETIARTLDKKGNFKFKRVDKSIKLGGERENYRQTTMWGYNIVDVSHAVRRAKAINSNIKSWGLKYVTKFSELNKKNRVYIKGSEIYNTWADTETDYAFNNEDGTYYPISEIKPLKDGYHACKGAEIVRRYLSDDLWETEQVDGVFNQASFLLGKIIPTGYMRSSTMGTAGIWKLIMAAWSYENRLAIPDIMPQKTFTGGLSRLLEVGFANDVGKTDYAALYPNIGLTWGIFPELDISGAMNGMLLYIASTRDIYKGLMNEAYAMKDKLKDAIKNGEGVISDIDMGLLKDEYERQSGLASMYDRKQLPIKILGNSFFGSLGAPNIFPWGDTDCAEEITCRGRQYLRLMVKSFVDKGFRPLVGDTDGFNFAIPDEVVDYRYTPKGTHRFTEDRKGNEIEGFQAVVDEFNELYMIGRMGLDIDDICQSTINFSRKNYANLIKGKVKLVGNTIKSSKMPIYIEEFLAEAIEHLLNGDGYEFIQLYNETVEKIYNFQIPLVKIASKANIKQTMAQYDTDMLTKTKSGSFKAKKAHMELLKQAGERANLGGTVYYVNIGTVKSHGDCKVITDKETGVRTVQLQSKLISTEQIENDPDLTTDEYNVPKYLEAFNKRIHPLLVCFDPEIREKIVINMVKNQENKEMELTEMHAFTRKQCQMSSGKPFKDGDQDTVDELMTMEDKEIAFWRRVNKTPNNLEDLDMDWEEIKRDYVERKRVEKLKSMAHEELMVTQAIKMLDASDIDDIKETNVLPSSLSLYAFINVHDDDDGNPMIYLTSIKWGNDFVDYKGLFKYQPWAIDRQTYYETLESDEDMTFENWLRYVRNQSLELSLFDKATIIENEMKYFGYDVNIKKEP